VEFRGGWTIREAHAGTELRYEIEYSLPGPFGWLAERVTGRIVDRNVRATPALGRAIWIVVSLMMMGASWWQPAPAAASPLPPGGPPVPGQPALRDRPRGPFQVCPVDRPRHYIDDFGQPRWGGGFHLHQGIDMFAPWGSPARAPFVGRVEWSSNWAGGLSVRVFGKHGFVYEAHLSSYGKDGRVRAGDIVGHVGNTGDAIGGSPHDHFEWHPNGGPAVDPFSALGAVCGPKSHPRPMGVPWLAV
jgi:Peptidase family M23